MTERMKFETRDLFGSLTAVDVISIGPGGSVIESTQLGLEFEETTERCPECARPGRKCSDRVGCARRAEITAVQEYRTERAAPGVVTVYVPQAEGVWMRIGTLVIQPAGGWRAKVDHGGPGPVMVPSTAAGAAWVFEQWKAAE